MRSKIFITIALAGLIAGCNKTDEFLTKLPLDELSDETYWANETTVRTFAWGFYPNYFPGYASGFDLGWGGYFSGETLNDDFAPTTPAPFIRNIPTTASSAGWDFTWIRKANIFINRVQKVPMPDETIRHWLGVARFFRAFDYARKVKNFGDLPWYNTALTEVENDLLYKPRDPRTLVVDSILADFKYAADNVRAVDNATGPKGLVVNKFVVLAFMSRVFLFEGTWQRYHANNEAKATEYLEAAKWAANEVITKGGYTVGPDYRKLFNSLDLSTNPEIIMYRKYQSGLLTHSLNSYVNKESQTGASKNAIESYLCKDGLPISLSPMYKGDKGIDNVMTDRDPRMDATFVKTLRLAGLVGNYSTSGYPVHKFLNEDIKDLPNGNSSLNDTHAPVIRFGEVLMNYAEACAELGSISQDDLDKSINKLRKRAGIAMPNLEVAGGLPAVNGKVYDDPKRDPGIPAMIWEIRRERRVELMMEGFRSSDLRRWKKLEYTDVVANFDINRGAWIRRSDYPAALSATIENNKDSGYIVPAPKPETWRVFNNPRVYLNPLPTDQIKLYDDQGVELKQNPGW